MRHKAAAAAAAVLLAGAWLLTAACGGGNAPGSEARVIGRLGRQGGEFSKHRAVAVTTGSQILVIDRSGRCQVLAFPGGEYERRWNFPEWSNGTPTGVTLDPDGTVWVADTHYQRILNYRLDGALVRQWGERGTSAGLMIFPTDAAPDPDGKTIWVTEFGIRSRVMRFTRDGQFLTEWGSGEFDYGDFGRPQSVVVLEDRLIIADAANSRIRFFDKQGHEILVWGDPGTEPGQLKYPYDLALAADGTLYICEYGNSRISRFTLDGKFLGSWGRAGGGPGELASPWGIALGPGGELVIADTANDRIKVLIDPVRAFTPAPRRGAI